MGYRPKKQIEVDIAGHTFQRPEPTHEKKPISCSFGLHDMVGFNIPAGVSLGRTVRYPKYCSKCAHFVGSGVIPPPPWKKTIDEGESCGQTPGERSLDETLENIARFGGPLPTGHTSVELEPDEQFTETKTSSLVDPKLNLSEDERTTEWNFYGELDSKVTLIVKHKADLELDEAVFDKMCDNIEHHLDDIIKRDVREKLADILEEASEEDVQKMLELYKEKGNYFTYVKQTEPIDLHTASKVPPSPKAPNGTHSRRR